VQNISEIEAEILKGCKKGKLKYQEQLYKQFYSYGMSISLRYAYSREESLEILNDSFLKVFNNIDSFDAEKSFKAWFRRIIINTSIDYYRKTKRIIFVEPSEYAKNEIFSQSDVDNLHVEDLLNLLNALPEIYRITFNLYEIEGYKHEEIAEILQITASTSRSNLTRAKKMLREAYQNQYSNKKIVRMENFYSFNKQNTN